MTQEETNEDDYKAFSITVSKNTNKIEELNDLTPSSLYKYIPQDILIEMAVVVPVDTKILTRLNTTHFYMQNRQLHLKEDIKNVTKFYFSFKNEGKKFNLKCKFMDPLRIIEILSNFTILNKKLVAYEKLTQFYSVLIEHKTNPSVFFLENVFRLRNDALNKKTIMKYYRSTQCYEILLKNDLYFAIKSIQNYKQNEYFVLSFLQFAPTIEIVKLRDCFMDKYLSNYIERLDEMALPQIMYLGGKNIFVLKEFWTKNKNSHYSVRFSKYEKIELVDDVFEMTKKLLKKLCVENIDYIAKELECFIFKSAISVFNALFEVVCSYDSIIPILRRVLEKFNSLFLDILNFTLFTEFTKFKEVVVNDNYVRKYVNFCTFVVCLWDRIDFTAILEALHSLIDNKYFSRILLLNLIVEKYSAKHSVLSSFTEYIFMNAINELFLYENHTIKFKLQLCEIYKSLYRNFSNESLKIKVDVNFENLCYFTQSEIISLCDKTDINELVRRFKETEVDDYFKIKNLILLLDANKKEIVDEKYVESFLKIHSTGKREDLRVLSESCLSKIIVSRKRIKVEKIVLEDGEVKIPK